jgi:hypothetical protein
MNDINNILITGNIKFSNYYNGASYLYSIPNNIN